MVKNNKIELWRIELVSFSYNIQYCPSKDNVAPDTFTHAFCGSIPTTNLVEIHSGLCHPGATRMLHFVRSKNLQFSTEDVGKFVCPAKFVLNLSHSFIIHLMGNLLSLLGQWKGSA